MKYLFLALTIVSIQSQVLIDHYRFGSGGGGSGNDLLLDLQGYWKMDEASGDILDSTSFNRHLTEDGGVIAAGAGILNGDRIFTGSGKVATAAGAGWNSVEGLDFTILCWVKLTSFPTIGNIYWFVIKAGFPDTSYGIGMQHKGDGSKNFVFYSVHTPPAGIDILEATPSPDITTGVWYFVAARYNTTTKEMRLSYGTGSTLTLGPTLTAVDDPQNQLGVFNFGGRHNLDGETVDGELDEIAMWTRRLSDSELTIIFNSGTPLPFSSYTF